MSRRQLVLVELNEVNFDFARGYVNALGLKNFARMFNGHLVKTSSESAYEELEPWIQWVSVHSGLHASEHGVFRLGDIVGSNVPQVFEQLEALGYKVGCISAMNAENRLKAPAYFIPDPWTKTPTDGSFWSRALGEAISQAVNDNAEGKITASSALNLLLGLVRFAHPRNYATYARLGLGSRKAPWRKALFLDLFLHDTHASRLRSKRPNFSTLFLNAGAHIQHHYFLNAKLGDAARMRNPAWYVPSDVDPFAEMLRVYDVILGAYLDQPGIDVIVATGLTQQPYDRIKFYYRLKDHRQFLDLLGVPCSEVLPRMTRDFLIECESPQQALQAQQLLAAVRSRSDGLPIFGEIDNRGSSLFVTMTYPEEISQDMEIEHSNGMLKLHPHVAFVAIKNGMHHAQGYAYFSTSVAEHAPNDGAHVSQLYHTIRSYFGIAA